MLTTGQFLLPHPRPLSRHLYGGHPIKMGKGDFTNDIRVHHATSQVAPHLDTLFQRAPPPWLAGEGAGGWGRTCRERLPIPVLSSASGWGEANAARYKVFGVGGGLSARVSTRVSVPSVSASKSCKSRLYICVICGRATGSPLHTCDKFGDSISLRYFSITYFRLLLCHFFIKPPFAVADGG